MPKCTVTREMPGVFFLSATFSLLLAPRADGHNGALAEHIGNGAADGLARQRGDGAQHEALPRLKYYDRRTL